MAVETRWLHVETRGDGHVVDLTGDVAAAVARSEIRNGTVTVFVVGSTAGITTTEFEPGLASHDLAAMFERIAPKEGRYRHEETWHDDNGHAHCQAALLGPSLTVPVLDGRLTLGQWQQIVLLDFDTRARRREVVVQIIGEA
ncbi:MAG: secondary thiamine-phosphate synthase enzyme YjbQ [Phycisphaerae bacterium]|nr:secondary thiamine-phosphate synthase enzyme YjbQ [Phycisphaerae bacterium]